MILKTWHILAIKKALKFHKHSQGPYSLLDIVTGIADAAVLLVSNVNSVFLEVKLECELNPEKYNAIYCEYNTIYR